MVVSLGQRARQSDPVLAILILSDGDSVGIDLGYFWALLRAYSQPFVQGTIRIKPGFGCIQAKQVPPARKKPFKS